MEANYAVTGEKEEMSYQEIGAIGGFRYLFTYAGSSLQVEFYQFDLENLDEKAQACLDSVKAQGTFTVLDNQVPAVLSDNGRYLMIYTDAGDSEESTAQRQRVEELFRASKRNRAAAAPRGGRPPGGNFFFLGKTAGFFVAFPHCRRYNRGGTLNYGNKE